MRSLARKISLPLGLAIALLASPVSAWDFSDWETSVRDALDSDWNRQAAEGLIEGYDKVGWDLRVELWRMGPNANRLCVMKTKRAWWKLGQALRNPKSGASDVLTGLDNARRAFEKCPMLHTAEPEKS